MASKWKSLQDILNKIEKTLSAINYFSILLLLFITIYALLGMEIFAHEIKMDKKNQIDYKGTSPRINFDDFFHAFLAIFIVLVGDDWQFIYFDAIRAVGYGSTIYFVSLIILGNFIVLNLFLAILLDNFESEDIPEQRLEKAKRAYDERCKSIAPESNSLNESNKKFKLQR